MPFNTRRLMIDGDFFCLLPAVAAVLLNFFVADRAAEGGVEGRSGVPKTSSSSTSS